MIYMKIQNGQKYLLHKMNDKDYRTGIIRLMVILEENSEEFKTPEQLIALIHEYSELMATVHAIDTDDCVYFDDDTDDECINSEQEDDGEEYE